jgi:hypothetical protein
MTNPQLIESTVSTNSNTGTAKMDNKKHNKVNRHSMTTKHSETFQRTASKSDTTHFGARIGDAAALSGLDELLFLFLGCGNINFQLLATYTQGYRDAVEQRNDKRKEKS